MCVFCRYFFISLYFLAYIILRKHQLCSYAFRLTIELFRQINTHGNFFSAVSSGALDIIIPSCCIHLQPDTHLQTGDGEVGYEPNDFWVVFYFDQLPQLVVALQPRQQAAELVVVVGIRQTLEWKPCHKEKKVIIVEILITKRHSDDFVKKKKNHIRAVCHSGDRPAGWPVFSSLRPPSVKETLLALRC